MCEKRKNCFKTPFLAIPMLINRKPVQKRGISENAVFPLLAFKRVKRIHLEQGQSKLFVLRGSKRALIV